jgi:hypothetical protein
MVAMEQAQNLDPSQSPDMQNFQVYQGVLRKRPGFHVNGRPSLWALLDTRRER